MKYNATFTSVWDGGLKINARCYVSKKNHSILRFGRNDARSSIEESLDILEDEYVTLDTGEKHKSMSEDSYERLLKKFDGDIEKLKGVLGIIVVY